MKTATPLTLGDPALDEEHAELQRLVDALLDAPPSGALAALDALKAHAEKHFAVEDADLRRMADPNAVCHLDEHAAVLKSLGEVGDFLLQPVSPPDMVRRLCMELTRWLPEHVQHMDAGIASVRTKERFGGVPVLIRKAGRD